ncbi:MULTISPECIES: sugar phosphate isomerase/epimerase [unclassified Bacillus (in: firmicutes)]|uniref:sugar phosphate isomerase/epimerase family protein n=1 Tax=unclassified Bacillus (in: firmicutes) TaxID=185979 RepID=UPI0011242FC6|nr:MULTISPECIES: sugar phosphate isomerase/epimerase family protein [unclassified Bacillus (in: firmicutes)]
MRKGINSWCFSPDLSLETTFKVTKEAGFDSIELNMSESMPQDSITSELGLIDNPALTLETTELELETIKNLSVTYQLPISSIATSLHWTYPLTSYDEKVRVKGLEIAKKMIEVCAVLGGDTVLIVPGVVTETNSYDDCYDLAQSALKELAIYAEPLGIVIGVENVWNKFLLSPLEMRRFLDEINHPSVKAYFDAGNVLQFGFPEQWVRILGERITKVHIKDFRQDIGNIRGFTGLLSGDMKWSSLMEALREIGYNGDVICELSPYKENSIQLAYDTSNAMKYILSK